jgi:hypothetical protein
LRLKSCVVRGEITLIRWTRSMSAAAVDKEGMTMQVNRFVVLVLLALAGAAASNPASASAPRPCDLRLTVALTPDVPNPRDPGFLSSLLSNHPSYQLILLQQRDSSVIGVELTGPGPESGCSDVVETMRRDGRVLSVNPS